MIKKVVFEIDDFFHFLTYGDEHFNVLATCQSHGILTLYMINVWFHLVFNMSAITEFNTTS